MVHDRPAPRRDRRRPRLRRRIPPLADQDRDHPETRTTRTGTAGTITLRGLMDFLNITGLTPVIRGPCDHARAEDRYRPSRKLAHLVRARNTTCTAPGCGRRAASCDLDHTDPHHQGGRTCECNLAPLCRHHHRCKQADGWRLEQPEPGVLVWHTPAGRTYTTTPTHYAA